MFIPDNVEGISFTNRPIAVPYNYRIIYRISQIILIIYYCCNRKACSLEKIHITSSALSTKDEMEKLLQFIDKEKESYILVRFNPAINRAIDFALAEDILIRQKNGLFKLSTKGKRYMDNIVKDRDLFIFEKLNLSNIGTKLTEDKISQLISLWRGSYV